MKRSAFLLVSLVSLVSLMALGCALLGCDAPKTQGSTTPGAAGATASAQASATMMPATTEQAFGDKLSEATPFVSLGDIYKDPKAYDGKRVRTRGEVVAVCQAAGCWCDLRPEGDPKDAAVPTHVMMHDHAFLLPKTAKSKVAEIEGTLVVKALSQSEVDHYNAEGASLVAGTPMVNVDAVGVVLR